MQKIHHEICNTLSMGQASYHGIPLMAVLEKLADILPTTSPNHPMHDMAYMLFLYGKHKTLPCFLPLNRRPWAKNFLGHDIEHILYIYGAMRFDFFISMLRKPRTIYLAKDQYTQHDIIIHPKMFQHLLEIEACVLTSFLTCLVAQDKASLSQDVFDATLMFFEHAHEKLPKAIIQHAVQLMAKCRPKISSETPIHV